MWPSQRGLAEKAILLINGEFRAETTRCSKCEHVRGVRGCSGQALGKPAEQVSQTLDQFSTALKRCLISAAPATRNLPLSLFCEG
jgi:hypothetical protein